jgi:hypothetical protein
VNWPSRRTIEHLVAGLDAKTTQDDAVVAPPVFVDASVIGPGVIAGRWYSSQNQRSPSSQTGAHLVLGDRASVVDQRIRERLGQRAARREEREAASRHSSR